MQKFFFGIVFIILSLQSPCAFALYSTKIEQNLTEQIKLNPNQAFYKVEALLTDPELTAKEKAILMVLQTEVAYYIDQPEYILHYAELAMATGELNERWHTRALISQARGYFQRGQFNLYFSSADMALTKATRAKLAAYKVSAIIERAFASTLLSDLEHANQDLTLAQKYLALLPKNFDKAIILERFSAVNSHLNNAKIAILHQKQAIDIYQNINSAHFLSIGYYNLGRIYQQLEQWQKASELMLASYHKALEDNNALNQAFSLSRLSEFQYKLAQPKLAKKYLYDAIVAADVSPSARVKIHVRKNMANVLCDNKAYQECKNLLLETVALAKTNTMQRDQIQLMEILAEAYYHLAMYEEAYKTLQSSNQLNSNHH
ncbi:tetratricopeptide repeat protein [Colwellia chukchiensis]|uniref:tetratricopeptide repeat protein n=1 Tax=Colwellia chukchiensis TaxID=641665 RepID=UPI000A17683A|nr:hypothetical protein [Colwellia chukchiensis]